MSIIRDFRSLIWSFKSFVDLVLAELDDRIRVGVGVWREEDLSVPLTRFSRVCAAELSIPNPRIGGIFTLSGVVSAVLGLALSSSKGLRGELKLFVLEGLGCTLAGVD